MTSPLAKNISPSLLVTNSVYRIQARSLTSGIPTEEHPGKRANQEGNHDRIQQNTHRPPQQATQRQSRPDTEQDTNDSSGNADNHRLNQELEQNMSSFCPDRHTQPDLPGTFRHRDIHDIHNSDSPN